MKLVHAGVYIPGQQYILRVQSIMQQTGVRATVAHAQAPIRSFAALLQVGQKGGQGKVSRVSTPHRWRPHHPRLACMFPKPRCGCWTNR